MSSDKVNDNIDDNARNGEGDTLLSLTSDALVGGNAARASVNLEDIARLTGVSKMTVSRVLRNSSGFSEQTRDKVIKAAETLGYIPNRLAAAFSSDQASTLVGICVPRLTSAQIGQVLEGIDHGLNRFGFQMMVGCSNHSDEEEETWLRQIISWRPAGLILTGTRHTAGARDMIRAAGLPVVEVMEASSDPIDLSIGVSHYDAGHALGCHLLRRGRQKVAILGALSGKDALSAMRFDGLRAALAAGGHPLLECELLHDVPSFYAGYYGTEILLARRRDLDAICYHNDDMAIGALAYCAAKGIAIPEQIGIAGWGSMEAAAILPRRLTTTLVPNRAMGKQAAEALVARLRGEPVARSVRLTTQLIPGETV